MVDPCSQFVSLYCLPFWSCQVGTIKAILGEIVHLYFWHVTRTTFSQGARKTGTHQNNPLATFGLVPPLSNIYHGTLVSCSYHVGNHGNYRQIQLCTLVKIQFPCFYLCREELVLQVFQIAIIQSMALRTVDIVFKEHQGLHVCEKNHAQAARWILPLGMRRIMYMPPFPFPRKIPVLILLHVHEQCYTRHLDKSNKIVQQLLSIQDVVKCRCSMRLDCLLMCFQLWCGENHFRLHSIMNLAILVRLPSGV